MSVLLRKWEAVVLRTVQIHGRVYVKQLPKLLAESPFVAERINESRYLQVLEGQGYLRSRYQPMRRGLTRHIRVYWITRHGEKALQAYQKYLLELSKFIGNRVLKAA